MSLSLAGPEASRPREQTKTDDSFSGPRKDYGPERDPCKRRSDRRLVSHGIMLSDLSWDLWVNGSSPAAGLTRDVFGGGEDKNHEPIMLPLALFFSLSLFHERQEAECGRMVDFSFFFGLEPSWAPKDKERKC
jgi:hypothetical protein